MQADVKTTVAALRQAKHWLEHNRREHAVYTATTIEQAISALDAGAALLAQLQAQPDPATHDDGSPAPEDNIAKAKRIMNAVDDYHDQPTNATRGNLRAVVLDQLAATAQPDPEPVAQPVASIMSLAEFCKEAERTGLTASVLAEALSKRPEFADCLPQPTAQPQAQAGEPQQPEPAPAPASPEPVAMPVAVTKRGQPNGILWYSVKEAVSLPDGTQLYTAPQAEQRAPLPETLARQMFDAMSSDRRTRAFSLFNWFTAGATMAEEFHGITGGKAAAGSSHQPLTDEEILQLARKHTWFNGSHAMTNYVNFARAILERGITGGKAA